MFSFRYYEDYTSMYELGMMALIAILIADVYAIIRSVKNRDDNTDEKTLLLAVISLVIIIIAPLGSNNHTYQNLNNLFLVLPITVTICFDIISRFLSMRRNNDKKGTTIGLPFSIMAYVLIVVILIQSYGFHLNFVFRDGMRGEKRDFLIEECDPDELMLYGNCPGLTYVTGIPSALSSSWPDLDSNPVDLIENDLSLIGQKIDTGDYRIIAIIRNEDVKSEGYCIKKQSIKDFLNRYNFNVVLESENFIVYEN